MTLRVAVVAVGDELLLGDVVNRNLAWLGTTLAAAGLPVVRGYEVGDDVGAMVEVLRGALEVADAVVVCGGLGPTSDDRTRAALAALAGVRLRRDPALLDRLTRWYADRGRRLPGSAAGQADLPEGARPMENPLGSAVGIALEVAGAAIYAVPGVPRELYDMVDSVVVPELRARAGGPPALRTEQLRVAGLGESLVAQLLAPLEADLPEGARLAYLASPGEVRVRFTGSDPAPLGQARQRAAELLGDAVTGYGDETLPMTVLRLLGQRGQTVAVAESLTGGLLASALVDVPGASSVVAGGVLAYATRLKEQLLDVPADLLRREGPVHPEVAAAMARGVAARLGADWGLAATGVAGPDPQDGVEPGTVYVGVSGPGHAAGSVVQLRLRGDRVTVRTATVAQALDLLRRAVLGLATAREDRA